MNYRHVYMLIIEHAKSEEKLGIRKKGNGNYYESHHILPRSLFPLWVKRKSNIVLLTAREHFFCHQLLTKIYHTQQMFKALAYFMSNPSNRSKRITTSYQYEICRKASVKASSLQWKNNNFREYMFKNCLMFKPGNFNEKYGIEKANEIRAKLSMSRKGKTPFKGHHRDNEQKGKIRNSMKNRKACKCITLDIKFASIREAANYFLVDNKRLSKHIAEKKPIIKRLGEFKGKELYFELI